MLKMILLIILLIILVAGILYMMNKKSNRSLELNNKRKKAVEEATKIYCLMRSYGNSHEVSWSAAYAVLNKANSGIFKLTTKQAVVLITEEIVNNPEKYPECGKYLGDIYKSY